jgi:isopentenyl-diphosphate delta-isomerase
MRQALESQSQMGSFSIVRDVAKTIPIYANIGGAEVAAGLSKAQVKLLIEIVRADGLIVHLNPAQELFQPEGNTNFKGFLLRFKKLCSQFDLPVIVKEVGNGISVDATKRLLDAGADAIDIAGAGGTNWQKVEEARYIEQHRQDERFTDGGLQELLQWGIPTAQCLDALQAFKKTIKKYRDFEIVASGGITNGVEIAKALALGASIAALAKPFLKAAFEPNGKESVKTLAHRLMNDLRAVMFLTGAETIEHLRQIPLIRKDYV